MPRKRDHGYQSLTSMAIFKALDLISGHSRPLEPSPTVLRPRRPYAIPSHGKAQPARKPSSTWPGAEVPVEFPHLLPRTRSLTPPPSDADAESSILLEQTQSPLLNLPPEVLLSIYKEVLGMNTIHIVRRKDKLGHTICKINEQQSHEACKHAQCRGLKLQAGVHVKAGPGYSSLLPLLQTCRKIYTDAIEVLYNSNIFDFDSMESLVWHSTAILPKRFDAIHRLQLEFCFSTSSSYSESTAYSNFPRWERTWRVVGSIKSLQELWVWISWHRLNFGPVEEARLLEQLDQVRQLKTFEVSLPALRGKKVKTRYEQLFNITRRG